MNFELTPEQIETQKWARAFAKEVVLPQAKRHADQKISRELLERVSREGMMTLSVPESLGGLGLDAVSTSLVIREISWACGSVGVTMAVTNMIADVLVREGSNFHHEHFLKKLVTGESVTASFCLTENSSGSDASSLRSSAMIQNDSAILTGEKIYVTNGAFSDFFLVMAKTSPEKGAKGITAFLVPRGATGFVLGKEENKMGLTGSSTLRLSLENVRVPLTHQVGPEGDGFKIAMRALDGGRISVSSQALGIATASLEAGVSYAKERHAFGRPIADNQAIQWKFADASVQLSAAELLVLRAASLKDQKKSHTLAAAQAKLFTTEMAAKICEDMIQVHGGYGYTKDYPVERYFRDVRVTTLYEGTSEIQRLVIAREILK